MARSYSTATVCAEADFGPEHATAFRRGPHSDLLCI